MYRKLHIAAILVLFGLAFATGVHAYTCDTWPASNPGFTISPSVPALPLGGKVFGATAYGLTANDGSPLVCTNTAGGKVNPTVRVSRNGSGEGTIGINPSGSATVYLDNFPSVQQAGNYTVQIMVCGSSCSSWYDVGPVTYEASSATWQTLGPNTGLAGANVSVNGQNFNPSKTYVVKFAGHDADYQNPGPATNSTSTASILVKAPNIKVQGNDAPVQVYEKDGGKLHQVNFTGASGANIFSYTDTCPSSVNSTGAIQLGEGWVQTKRQTPSGSSTVGSCNATSIKNPAMANRGAFAATGNLAKPYRYISWASTMLTANNTVAFHRNTDTNATGVIHRQSPIYADPVSLTYTNEVRPDYYAQDGATGYRVEAVHGLGFQLSTANPAMDGASTYNSGNGADSYNQLAKLFNSGKKDIQEGFSQLGAFSDTLAVMPVASGYSPGDAPAYLPPAALMNGQGDFNVDLVMPGPGFDETNFSTGAYLRLFQAQGGPFTQFLSRGNDKVALIGVYPVDSSNPSGASSGISATKTISGLKAATGGSSTLNYVIVHQQVNDLSDKTATAPRKNTNWVSFAVAWDPALASMATSANATGNQFAVLAFTSNSTITPFVVAALPNQMANSNTASDTYDAELADEWAKAVLPYAFNFITDTGIRYAVDKDPTGGGAVVASNEVMVAFTPTFDQQGPVSAADKTIFLLQPHQYSDGFDDGRSRRPVNNVSASDFLSFTTTNSTTADLNKYWISRGKLEAVARGSFSVNYAVPSLLPFLPPMTASNRTGANGISYGYQDLASAMIGANHYLGEANGQNSPATTSMDGNVPQDTYNVGKAFVRTGKMIHQLLTMQSSDPLPAKYRVGQTGQGGNYTSSKALALFAQNLDKAFRYYFGQAPTCANGNTDSYYYAYYDDTVNHLMMYPASGAAGVWPTDLTCGAGGLPPKLWDGFGTVTMMNDHHYTYGYHILAASLLSMAVQSDLMPDTLRHSPRLAKWQRTNLSTTWGPVVDALIMDIANDPDQVTSWYNSTGLSFQKMAFMDQYTGISWTDGFNENAVLGHNANSPWENLQAWAGVALWGMASDRTDVRDLGLYLLTQGLYSMEAYRWNTTRSYVPASTGSDHGTDGMYLFRATRTLPGQGNQVGTLPYTVDQQSTGQSFWERQMSNSGNDATSRVTYIFQGQIRSDNTYDQTPVGQQYTSTYPLTPWSLSMIRSKDYMTDWAQAIAFQNDQSHATLNYLTNTNLLYAALGLDQVVTTYNGTSVVQAAGGALPHSGGSTNYNADAFTFMQDEQGTDPFDWYWDKSTVSTSAQCPIWANCTDDGTILDKLSLYVSADKTIAEPLWDFWVFDTYGVPDASAYAVQGSGPTLLPTAMVFDKSPKKTLVAYNPSKDSMSVTFHQANGATIGTITSIPGFSLGVKTIP